MPKQFITERDIDDLASQGVTSLEVSDNIVLTELAYEKAKKLGFDLGKGSQANPAAPYRPYLSQVPKTPPAPAPAAATAPLIPSSPVQAAAPVTPAAQPAPCAFCAGKQGIKPEELRERVKKAALARMGSQVDPVLLENIIERVMNNIVLKRA